MMNRLLRLDLKIYMLCLLAASAVIGMVQHGITATLPQVLIALFTAGLADVLISYIKNKKIIFPLSALISGMIIALVLSPGVKWFIPLVASLAAILPRQILDY